VFDGRQRQLHVRIPRFEETVVVDGVLDEPVWARAARLTGFTQFLPVDGRPAADSTVVLVWYSSRAIYIGILAYEAHGAVHATLADRDRIASDDWVQIFLDTFDDRRQAYVFGVNPLGVQSDGILSEGVQARTSESVRDTVDLSTDYRYESRGRVTAWGYEVELRIPLKSLRFQSRREQRWGINIVRQVQHSGYQDTWAPARRASASFLAQSGTLDGLTDLTRGHALDLNPELTSRVDGAPDPSGWNYSAESPQVGGNLRYALTPDLTAGATVKPDFSQIESDAPQLVYDPRDALYYPEKRPFFLEGLEQFSTPNQLIYTRRILQPLTAVKLTGKLGGADIGFLSAVDDAGASATGRDHPVFNLLRARHAVGGRSTVGAVVADREEGARFNRVYGADARILFGQIYSMLVQGAVSATRGDSGTAVAPLWQATVERSGRRLRLRYTVSGLHPDFRDNSGFIARTGVAHGALDQSVTFFGPPGGVFERWTLGFVADATWDYTRFVNGRAATDERWHLNNDVAFRGGWSATADVFIESYGYDPALYADYAIERHTGAAVDTVPFTGTPHIPNLDIVLATSTPRWAGFDGNINVIVGHDENFYEWASADIVLIDAGANWRPSDRLRVSALYTEQQYIRRTDRSTVGIRRVPRLKVEYQLARPIFLRVVGQYDAEAQDSLRDDSRTNDPILLRDPATGRYTRAAAQASNGLRVDWLFSYQPTPGTVIFLGYGNSMAEPAAFAFRGLRRTSDSFFAKVSWLFRLGA